MGQYTSYWLYQKYEKRGDQDWLPTYPNVWSADGNGSMPLIKKIDNDPACGYDPHPEVQYRWVNIDPSVDYYCEECSVDPSVKIYRWNKAPSSDYACSGTTKMYKEYYQYSTDGGVTWQNVIPTSSRTSDTIIEYNSEDCGYDPSYVYRWAKAPSSDYACVGVDKHYKEYYQYSTDGGSTWHDFVPEQTRPSSDVIEYNSEDCGYEILYRWVRTDDTVCINDGNKLRAVYNNGNTYELVCNDSTRLTRGETNSSGYYISGMTSAVIGDCVTSIGISAFEGCKSLTSVTIPDSVNWVADDAFFGCSSLTNINIPNGVTYIGNGTFYGCSSLTNITIPSGVTTIGEVAFKGCSGLTSLTIPDNVTHIHQEAFENCSNITNINIGSGLTTIDWGAFGGCTSITSLTLPNSVTSINGSAFAGLTGITEITIPSGVTYLGPGIFQGCSGLTSITCLPTTPPSLNGEAFDSNPFVGTNCLIYVPCESVKSYRSAWAGTGFGCLIKKIVPIPPCEGFKVKLFAQYNDGERFSVSACGAYSNRITTSDTQDSYCGYIASAMTDAVIGDCVTEIGPDAFSNCQSLSSITIGSGVTTISKSAFNSCFNLTSITLPDSVTSIGDSAFTYCSSLTNITIPSGVTSIGESAFEHCSSLTSCTIGSSVTTIKTFAFFACTGLTSITIEATTPPNIYKRVFENTNNCPIYVPAESVQAYKTAGGNWSTWADRIQAIQ